MDNVIIIGIVVAVAGLFIFWVVRSGDDESRFMKQYPTVRQMSREELLATFGADNFKAVPFALWDHCSNVLYPSESICHTMDYVSGHPQLDNSTERVMLMNDGDAIRMLVSEPNVVITKKEIALIPKAAISNITIEDATTIEKRFSIGRMMLVGVFALAWRKKEVTPLSFLVIEWTDGKFKHETLFQLTGADCIQRANTNRNKLIRWVN